MKIFPNKPKRQRASKLLRKIQHVADTKVIFLPFTLLERAENEKKIVIPLLYPKIFSAKTEENVIPLSLKGYGAPPEGSKYSQDWSFSYMRVFIFWNFFLKTIGRFSKFSVFLWEFIRLPKRVITKTFGIEFQRKYITKVLISAYAENLQVSHEPFRRCLNPLRMKKLYGTYSVGGMGEYTHG